MSRLYNENIINHSSRSQT